MFKSPIRKAALSLFLLMPLNIAMAASGYWTNSAGVVWKNSYGQCWQASGGAVSEACEPAQNKMVTVTPPQTTSQTIEAPGPAVPVVVEKPAQKQKMIVLTTQVSSGEGHFSLNQARLSSVQISQLKNGLSDINPQNIDHVEVIAYTDPTGSASYNLKLSQKRARVVAHYLSSKLAIPAEKIHVQGKGASDLIVTMDQCHQAHGRKALAACLAPDRRAVVKVFYRLGKE